MGRAAGVQDGQCGCPQPPAQEGFHLQPAGAAAFAFRQSKQQGGCSVELHRIWVVLGHKIHSFSQDYFLRSERNTFRENLFSFLTSLIYFLKTFSA